MSVQSVSISSSHTFSKPPVSAITLVTNRGVQGDCHFGETVQHQSRLHIKPAPTNLRQVHLIPIETLEKIDQAAGKVVAGSLGENITTRGLDLVHLSRGTELHFKTTTSNQVAAVVVLTGLRNPCPQIDKFQTGLKERFVVRDAQRNIIGRLAGVMGVVKQGGIVTPGMKIVVVKPAVEEKLEVV
ncbi:hypothetical protein ASPZODRAFT_136103 [Penicilliopsis zonata CBS 506.65]|uniref:MOSC domain-containing protein n=1 Tax=Penicilliopsis zonata CBS 506.65 TaxID=1073090 RepID=A0A1L9S8Z9_9EURO|nr:hypothetical protein ASPZODRAFT_136103 [Penicilliopsis zonata CBS 506.65]OJJ43652.1 hypothetical protein ASPZODRAFT_136103 [Penicilliopsis zonata CBS 506.65]